MHLRAPALRSNLIPALMLFGLFLTSLSFPTIAFAQNSISGKLINGPGSSSQDVPSRWVTMDKHELFPAEITSVNTQTNSSEAYSLSYSGGPFFSFNQLEVYVNPGLNDNPVVNAHASCISQADINFINSYVDGTISLSNLQRVAADVNIDGVVDLRDRNMLESAILGSIAYFNNSITVGGIIYSDRTIIYPTTSEVASLGDTINLTYTYSYKDPNILFGSNSGKNFYSVRLGDVNGNCATYNGLQTPPEGTDYKPSAGRSMVKDGSSLVTIYPNPVVSQLQIRTSGQNISGIELFDLSGKVLFANKTPGDSSKFNLNGESVSNLPPGTYVIKISLDDDTQVIEKFLKK